MRNGVKSIYHKTEVNGRVFSFILIYLTFCCFLAISSFIYNIISSNTVYADCSASMAIDGSVSLDVKPNDGNITTDTVTVNTDCLNGYTLSISAPSDSSLYLNGDPTNNTTYISSTSGTVESPTSIVGEGKYNTWGISMDSETVVGSSTFFSIPNERTDIYSKDSPSETGGDDITIYYGASASNDLKAGAYTMANDGKITYYLVAHPGTIVYFDADGGTTPSFISKEVTPGEPYGELPTTSKNGYTLLGWGERLPSEYQAVEYIESDGNQYIDTGVVTSDTTGIYAKVLSNDISTDSVYFGSKIEGRDTRFWIANESRYIYYGWNDNTFRQERINTTDINEISLNYLNNRKAMFNNVVVKDITTTLATSNNLPIYLFAANIEEIASYKSKIRLYELRISVGSNMEHDYIPCYRKSDRAAGVYDIIEGAFYANNGTESFRMGNVVLNEFVTPSTQVVTNTDHTLYAIWE